MGKTYFVSDVHLGLGVASPKKRESDFVAFLRSLPDDTEALYLLGDIWDFWYEYRDVVPRGYVRVLGALADLVDRGVRVCFFQGNHDVWTYSYFRDEIGMVPLEQPFLVRIGDKRFCLGHGDGLGPGDKGYKFLRCLFHNSIAQTLFSFLHPWLAFRFGHNWSRHNRLARGKQYEFRGEEEPIYKFADEYGRLNGGVDYYVFGHYHCEVRMPVASGGELFVLGDWIHGRNYLVFEEGLGMKSGYTQKSE